ncbi:hypothetical protein EYF80_020192 [Liparis tanakae]|uniref:Uncharacterized protein n=1 Tax=Liparis tanakae TaxID=230148 RepID=A0A4Z2HV22_9TELE|nr:hypothetical protein EYF80_020192 [Liparis tanakae]
MTGMEHRTIHPIIDVEMLQSEQQSDFTNEVCSEEHETLSAETCDQSQVQVMGGAPENLQWISTFSPARIFMSSGNCRI